ncbi:MAG: class I SAM-dependent methyltransferase, partial [Microbacteriaceae bacterium]
MSAIVPSPPLDDLIDSWESQQEAYIRHRAQRFGIILDALTHARPDLKSVLDIGAGLGSFSKVILHRFPDVTVRVLDYDPALLQLARHNLAEYSERVTIIEADLRDPECWTAIGSDKPDAIVSSTALHWLPTHTLVRLYRDLANVLGEQGLFFNA